MDKQQWQKAIDDFEEVTRIRFPKDRMENGVKIVWEWIEEGTSGSYQADDPNDEPLLRFSCSVWAESGTVMEAWEELPDSSYCTNVPINTPKEVLGALADQILNEIADMVFGGHRVKKTLERLSHIENDGCKACGSMEGYEAGFTEHHSAKFDITGNWVEDMECLDSGPSHAPYTCLNCGAVYEDRPWDGGQPMKENNE